jgi:flagella basal body P-ring formation protein FlgA
MSVSRYSKFLSGNLAFVVLAGIFASAPASERSQLVYSEIEHFFVEQLQLERQDILIDYPDLAEALASVEPFTDVEVLPRRNHVKPGIQVLRVGLFHEGRLRETIQVKVRTKTFQDVVVAAGRIDRHAIITPDDLSIDRRETTLVRKQFYLTGADVVGQRAKRFLQAGELVYADALESPPLVERGSEIEIYFTKGPLQISLPGVAREDGRLGDEIKVKCSETKKIFKGSVLDSGTVLVNL